MVLGVLSHENKVKNLLTFSPEHQDMVNKALGEIYSSFGIPEGNLEPQTWVGKVGVTKGRRYFLSRPRRFGKSLTLSILEAMFSGQAELFKGLSAEKWVSEQAKNPFPVIRFDMSGLRPYSSGKELNEAIIKGLYDFACFNDFKISPEATGSGTLLQIIYHLYKTHSEFLFDRVNIFVCVMENFFQFLYCFEW